jgi:uncharacterized protein YcbK (DUF882 family)
VRALIVALSLVLSAVAASAKAPKPQKVKVKPVELVALNTHEHFLLKPDGRGLFTRKGLAGWNRFLRCHHTGKRHAMAARLAELLYKVSRHFEDARILIVAGYRAPKVARKKGNPRSPHKQGLALDFRVEGVPSTELRDFVRAAFDRVGIGWYPNSDFVHLDVGRKHSAFWIDYSGPGEKARYAKDPEAALANENEPGLAPEEAPDEGGNEPQPPGDKGVVAPNLPALAPSTSE